MQAEGKPLAETSLLVIPLEAVTRLVLRAPGVVVAAALMLAVLAVLVTANGLRFKTSRLDLLNPRSEYNQRWLAYLQEFGDRDDAVIVVRAESTPQVTRAIDDLDAQLRTETEVFESIFSRRDLSPLKAKSLHFLPPEELAAIEQQVEAAASLAQAGQASDSALALAQMNERLARIGVSSPEARAALEREYGAIIAAMQSQLGGLGATAAPSPQPSPSGRGGEKPLAIDQLAADQFDLAQFEPQYLLADEGRVGFVLLRLKLDTGEFARGAKAIGQLRKTIADVRQRHPEVWIGLTGMPVIEFDEMQASQTDMVWTSVVSLAVCALLFVASYGGMRHALLANVVLLIAMAWSFGVITLVVGHLNILSSAFACVLIGVGIDYGTYYVACYLRLRGEGLGEAEALVETAREVGPSMITGGVTTAAAFFMTAMTDFVGVRELGLVAGYGILLCVVSAAVVLPPLVFLVDRTWPLARVPQILPAASAVNWPLARPRLVMLATLVATVAAGVGLAYLRYDHNLLNLQPKHLESADIERQILTQLEDSVWYAVSICDSPAELAERKAQFAALPGVAKCEDIASLLPEVTPQKTARIAAIRQHLADLPDPLFAAAQAASTGAPQQSAASLERLVAELDRAQRLWADVVPFETPTTAQLGRLKIALQQLPASGMPGPSAVVQASAAQSLAPLAQLKEMADPQPPALADLPQALADRFVGRSQKHLLKVYARGDIWDMEALERFVQDAEGIDPQITGHPVQTYYASRHMQSSYLWAGAYALAAVFVLLLFDFRHLGHTLLAMLPLAMGVVTMGGLLGWLGVPMNPANMIALPLILGLGVDNGVHLVHEWRRSPGPFQLSNSTAVALLLIATTTTASFGALVLARHQGLQSLGQVLTIGVTTCFAASTLCFPALLAWLSRNRRDIDVGQASRLPVDHPESRSASEGQTVDPALMLRPSNLPADVQGPEPEPVQLPSDFPGEITLVEDEDSALVPLPVAFSLDQAQEAQAPRRRALPRRTSPRYSRPRRA